MKKHIREKRPTAEGKRKRTRRILVGSLIALVLLVFVLPFLGCILIYEDNFNQRFETGDFSRRLVSEFQGLEVEECTFPSRDGQLLAGYTYSKGTGEKKGILVFAHGFGGGGHNSYLDILDYFASNDYLVFAYDATGNDKSQGKAVGGLPQGVIDLDYALRYVKSIEEWEKLPIVLLGHSWGAYSVCSVLEFHPDVKAVVSCSGFDRSLDMIEAEGRNYMGDGIGLLLPYLSLYERIKFGGYADSSSMTGVESSDAKVMVIHSMDDTVVPPQYGFDKYFTKYQEDGRFTFVQLEDQGHNLIFYSHDAREYRKQFDAEYKAYLASLDTEPTEEMEEAYTQKHWDYTRARELNEELLGQLLDFYGESISG